MFELRPHLLRLFFYVIRRSFVAWVTIAAAFVGAVVLFMRPASAPPSDRWIGLLMLAPLIPLLLASRVRLRAGPDGLIVDNLFRRYRLLWRDVEAVSIQPRLVMCAHDLILSVDRTGTWALPDGYSIDVVASWGLAAAELDRVVSEVLQVAALAGARPRTDRVTSLAELATSVLAAGRLESREPSTASQRWQRRVQQELQEDVECIVCGRVAPAGEMQPFGQETGEPSWYCRDEAACRLRSAAGPIPHE